MLDEDYECISVDNPRMEHLVDASNLHDANTATTPKRSISLELIRKRTESHAKVCWVTFEIWISTKIISKKLDLSYAETTLLATIEFYSLGIH